MYSVVWYLFRRLWSACSGILIAFLWDSARSQRSLVCLQWVSDLTVADPMGATPDIWLIFWVPLQKSLLTWVPLCAASARTPSPCPDTGCHYWSVPIMRVPYSQGLRWICQGVLISRLLDIRSFVEKPPGTPQAIVRVSRNLTEALTGSTEDALARCTKPKILCSVKPTYNYETQFMS